jgi:hypothetical protein
MKANLRLVLKKKSHDAAPRMKAHPAFKKSRTPAFYHQAA